jgi:O-antigen/teichoic acid export membrane protein
MLSKEITFLLTHSSIYGLGTVIGRMVSFLLLPLYTRYFTPSDYGILEALSVATATLGIVVTIGIARALGRFYYESENSVDRDKVLMTTYLTYIVVAILCIPLLLMVCEPLSILLFSTETYSYFFKISFCSLLLGGLIDIGLMYLRLIKKPRVFISITLTRLVCLIGLNVFFIVYMQMGIVGILYSTLIVRLLYSIGLTVVIWQRTSFGFSLSVCKEILRYSIPIIFSRLGSTAVKHSDRYFVLFFLSISDMGIYSLSLKFGTVIHQLFTAPFNLAYIPRRFEIMERPDAAKTFCKVFSYYVYFIVFAGLTTSVLIQEVMTFMVTPRFMEAADIIPLVVVSMVIFGTQFHFDFGVLYSKKTEYLAYTNIICACLQLTLNILLIPRFGLYGAVWSFIIVYSAEAVMLYRLSQRFFVIRYEFGRIFAYFLLAFVFYAISQAVATPSFLLDLFLKILLLAAFLPTTLLLRILSPEDKKILSHFVSSKVFSYFRKGKAVRIT